MLLSEVIDFLRFGELKQHPIAATGNIVVGDYPELITNVNLALIELYKRFPLKTKEIIIQQYNSISTYYLHSDYAASNGGSPEPIKYIEDGNDVEAFADDILRVTDIFNEAGESIAINDIHDEYSIMMPTDTSLQIPYPDDANSLGVIYRAHPVKILTTVTDASTEVFALSQQYIEALCAYIAYRFFAPINIKEETSEARIYYAKFEAAIALITNVGAVTTENTTNVKFGANGWV